MTRRHPPVVTFTFTTTLLIHVAAAALLLLCQQQQSHAFTSITTTTTATPKIASRCTTSTCSMSVSEIISNCGRIDMYMDVDNYCGAGGGGDGGTFFWNRNLYGIVTLASNENNEVLLSSSSSSSWRQYVPLIVILGVLFDIVLGSPLANNVLSFAANPDNNVTDNNDDDDDDGTYSNNSAVKQKNMKERVDTEAIARAAYEQAVNMRDLNEYLEKNKTDKQRMEDLMKKIDRQLED